MKFLTSLKGSLPSGQVKLDSAPVCDNFKKLFQNYISYHIIYFLGNISGFITSIQNNWCTGASCLQKWRLDQKFCTFDWCPWWWLFCFRPRIFFNRERSYVWCQIDAINHKRSCYKIWIFWWWVNKHSLSIVNHKSHLNIHLAIVCRFDCNQILVFQVSH